MIGSSAIIFFAWWRRILGLGLVAWWWIPPTLVRVRHFVMIDRHDEGWLGYNESCRFFAGCKALESRSAIGFDAAKLSWIWTVLKSGSQKVVRIRGDP